VAGRHLAWAVNGNVMSAGIRPMSICGRSSSLSGAVPRRSAGIVLFRRRHVGIEVLLVHPGGPFWVNKDEGAWSIPKGEFASDEDALAAARREFAEETGTPIAGAAIALGAFRQSSAKTVVAWAMEGDFDTATLKSNTFTMEWPPRSGKTREVPEVDRAGWFTPEEASRKLVKGQRPIIAALLHALHA
jgi:predicted NUDIX family NTP pyrophosphohydrolase